MYNKLSLALTLTACNAISIKNQTQECEHKWEVAHGCMHDEHSWGTFRYICADECDDFDGTCGADVDRPNYIYNIANITKLFS